MVWSDRLCHTGRNPDDYPQAGFHPYLVSAKAEPFAPLEVPAHAWLRAYDMAVPIAEPPGLPKGLEPLDVAIGNLRVLGWAHARANRSTERYAFYVRSEGGVPNALPVTFEQESGGVSRVIQPDATLQSPARLAGAAWFVLPALGPPIAEVRALVFGQGQVQRVPVQNR
jgi:hypothetical protein